MRYKIDLKKLNEYCKEKKIVGVELTVEERKRFLVETELTYQFYRFINQGNCIVCGKKTPYYSKEYKKYMCDEACYSVFYDEKREDLTKIKKEFEKSREIEKIKSLLLLGYDLKGISKRVELTKEEIEETIKFEKQKSEFDEFIRNREYKEIENMIKKNKKLLESRNIGGYTPLINAAAKSDTFLCELLIDLGANVNTKANGGQNAMMWIASNGELELIEKLIQHGYDFNAKDEEDEDVYTLEIVVLHWLNPKKKFEILDLFKKYINDLDSEVKQTFLKARMEILYN